MIGLIRMRAPAAPLPTMPCAKSPSFMCIPTSDTTDGERSRYFWTSDGFLCHDERAIPLNND
jgi:hypothetical protein